MPLTTKEIHKKSHVGFSSTRYRLEIDEYLPNGGEKDNASQERKTFPSFSKAMESRNQNQQKLKTLKVSLSTYSMQGL